MSNRTTMVSLARAYLERRRALGYALRSHGFVVLRFARFADRSRHRGPITGQLALRWLEATRASPAYAACLLSAVRSFARHAAERDGGRSEVPDPRLVPPRGRRKRPHIYSPDDLRQLLSAAGRLPLADDLGPATYRTLFGLMAATGLRVSEAVGLRLGHVDLEAGLLRVERGKLRRSRVVPLHPTVTRALRRYDRRRRRRWGARAAGGAFFVGSWGQALSVESAQTRFRQACERLGWTRGNGEMARPRLHDLRHTFACHCLRRLYRGGRDVHRHVPALAAYLGHRNVTTTYWYLTATPELLRAAGSRFERFAAGADRGHP